MELLMTEHELVSALLWIEVLFIPFIVYWYLRGVKKGPQGEMGFQGVQGMTGPPPTEGQIKRAVQEALKEESDGK